MKAALALLTVLGGAREPTPRALRWFPAVGAFVGAVVGGAWWLAGEAFPVLVAAVIAVIVDLVITGMLHVDGLADAADGLLPHAEQPRRLEIMRTPDVGAFGITVVGVVLLARVAALASTPADVVLIAALWCASRTTVAVAPAWLSYARDKGLATDLVTERAAVWPVVFVVPAIAAAAVTVGVAGAVAVVTSVLAAVGVLLFANRRLGGFTGDVLGAAIVVGETVGLVVAAARW